MFNDKHIYLVLGMPRSGTSAITRGLKALGIDLGEKLTPANEVINPTGFWEDNEIVYDINQRVLHALDMERICGLMDERDIASYPALARLKASAISLLQERMCNKSCWGFKDPAGSRIVPFWCDIFESLQIHDQYIIALRNPLSSAFSIMKHTRIDLETVLIQWLMHLVPAIDATAGKNRVVVSFESLMKDPRLQLERIQRDLVFPFVADQTAIDSYVNHFLDDNLRHFVFTENDLRSNSSVSVVPLCSEVYALLIRLANDKLSFNSAEFESAWSDIKQTFYKSLPVYQYIESLHVKNKTLEKSINTMRRSLPWKLIYPLRLLDDALRALRRSSRVKRKWARMNG